ncbi:MAG: CDGSH iron-sulfur domain-containing protein [Planctomycetota bacterium]|jgi:CDGSH-type Zn-finger protein
MSNIEMQVRDNGPLLVKGENIVLKDAEGNEYAPGDTFAICRCGKTGNGPFCDGAHKGGFESAPRAAGE